MRTLVIVLAPVLLTIAGCAMDEPVFRAMEVRDSQTDKVFDVTLAVLREESFATDLVSRQEGIIDTKWREQSGEVGLHSVPVAAARPDRLGEDLVITRRKAEAKIMPVGKDTRVKLRVLRQREQAQENYENVVFNEYDPMQPNRPYIIDPRQSGRRDRIWVPWGNDNKMERLLLEKIALRLDLPLDQVTIY